MAAFTLFPAETRVKLTLRQRAAMIAPMRSRVACVAVVGLVAAAGCNEGFSPTPACPRGFVGICGTATVRGTLPDSTLFYTLALPSGRYEWVLAVWQKQGTLKPDFSNADSLFREAGFYKDAGDTTSHGSGIVVVDGTATDSIDFVIDFGDMHRICTYFPPCP